MTCTTTVKQHNHSHAHFQTRGFQTKIKKTERITRRHTPREVRPKSSHSNISTLEETDQKRHKRNTTRECLLGKTPGGVRYTNQKLRALRLPRGGQNHTLPEHSRHFGRGHDSPSLVSGAGCVDFASPRTWIHWRPALVKGHHNRA